MRISDWSSDVCSSDLLKVARLGLLPQVLPVMLSNVLYMFESNTRSATILGIVGAGGIGFHLADRIRAHRWDEACAIVLMVLVTVYAIDLISKRSEEHTSELQSLMRNSYAVFCLKKKNTEIHSKYKQK